MEQTSLFRHSPMIPTTWLSLPWAFVRDAITSCRRVRMVRADWAAVVGGGGAFVIDTPANRCRSRAPLPRAAAVHLFRGAVSAGSGQTPSADEATAAVVVASASTGPTAAGSTGPTGMAEGGAGGVIHGGGASLAIGRASCRERVCQ